MLLNKFILTSLLLICVGCMDNNAYGTDETLKSEGVDLQKLEVNRIFNAIKIGDLEFYKSALDNGLNPNVFNEKGTALITFSAVNHDYRYIKLALESGGDPNTYDENLKRNLIFEVLGPDRLKHLETLLHYNADVNVKDGSGNTPIMAAAILSNYKAMKMLLDKGANAEMKNRFDETALDILNENFSEECKFFKCEELLEVKSLLKKQKNT